MSYSDAVAEDWRDRAKQLSGHESELLHEVSELRVRLKAAEQISVTLLAKMAELREAHRPTAVCDGCGWPYPHEGRNCHGGYEIQVCASCCTQPDGRQRRHCATADDHGDGLAICLTVAILDGAA